MPKNRVERSCVAMRRSRSMAGVHIHWSEARSVWLTISSATPFTSAGAVNRKIALLAPNEPMRRYSQRLTLTLLEAPITSSVPSYCCDLDRERFSDSATICRASCADADSRNEERRNRVSLIHIPAPRPTIREPRFRPARWRTEKPRARFRAQATAQLHTDIRTSSRMPAMSSPALCRL